jgi:hypothetical protein
VTRIPRVEGNLGKMFDLRIRPATGLAKTDEPAYAAGLFAKISEETAEKDPISLEGRLKNVEVLLGMP